MTRTELARAFAEHLSDAKPGSVFCVVVVGPGDRIGGTVAALSEGVPTYVELSASDVLGRVVFELTDMLRGVMESGVPDTGDDAGDDAGDAAR